MVAPFTGAWIEILLELHNFVEPRSLPSRGRGLKLRITETKQKQNRSLPSRGRGLKLRWTNETSQTIQSLPSRGRGLKCRP